MGAIAAMLGRLQGVFGKTFLMAGVLPALVLMLGLQWYRNGLTGVEALFVDFTAAEKTSEPEPKNPHEKATSAAAGTAAKQPETSNTAGVVVFRMVLLLAVGLFFFAIRHLILSTYQSLPLPQRLRQVLIDRQDVRRRKIEHREKLLSLAYTAMRWPKDKFPIPKYRVAGCETEPADTVFRKSKLAWDALKKAASRRGQVPIVRHREYCLIRDALISQYSYASAAKSRHPSVIDYWQSLMTTSTVSGLRKKAVYDICVARASQLWTRMALLKSDYPSPDYVMPTKLGTRLAALDEYAEARYGIDTTTLWLRLWAVLSKDEKGEVADAQTSVECLLNLATALLAMSLYILADDLWRASTLISDGQAHFNPRIAGFIIVPLVLSRLCYLSAVFAAIAFSERVTRYLDLYWLQFLKVLGFKLPPDAKTKTALTMLRELGAFYLAADSREISERMVEYNPVKREEGGIAPKPDKPKTEKPDDEANASQD